MLVALAHVPVATYDFGSVRIGGGAAAVSAASTAGIAFLLEILLVSTGAAEKTLAAPPVAMRLELAGFACGWLSP